MKFTNPRVSNSAGGITVDWSHGNQSGERYLAPGGIEHNLALGGAFGEIAPYVEPPKPEEPPTYATAEIAVAAMVAWIETFVSPLVSGAPLEERLSWPTKEIAARDYLAGTASPEDVAFIEAEAEIMTENPAELAELILDRATTFRAVASRIAGLRRKLTAAFIAEPDLYAFDAIFAGGKAEAEAMVIALGLGELFGLEGGEHG